METEADRQSLLSGLGGKFYPTAVGPLFAIFDAGYFESEDTEARLPSLTCTTVDAERFNVSRKGSTIDIDGKQYRVRRHEPDGTGISRLVLG